MKDDRFIFLTSPNLREVKAVWKTMRIAGRTLTDRNVAAVSVCDTEKKGIQFCNFDELIRKLIQEKKDDFKKFASENAAKDGAQFPKKYFAPLFDVQCKNELEKFVSLDKELSEKYKSLVFSLARPELEKFISENSGVKKIILCPNQIFVEDFFAYAKTIFEIRENRFWDFFDRIFHNEFYDGSDFIFNEKRFAFAAKKAGSTVVKISRESFFKTISKITNPPRADKKGRNKKITVKDVIDAFLVSWILLLFCIVGAIFIIPLFCFSEVQEHNNQYRRFNAQ